MQGLVLRKILGSKISFFIDRIVSSIVPAEIEISNPFVCDTVRVRISSCVGCFNSHLGLLLFVGWFHPPQNRGGFLVWAVCVRGWHMCHRRALMYALERGCSLFPPTSRVLSLCVSDFSAPFFFSFFFSAATLNRFYKSLCGLTENLPASIRRFAREAIFVGGESEGTKGWWWILSLLKNLASSSTEDSLERGEGKGKLKVFEGNYDIIFR